MSIKQLPQDVIDKIKSTVAITSMNGVVDSLLRNSLDSSATKIHVAVDYAKGDCSVEDNGQGILPTEFQSDGGLGKLHYTSKFPASSALYGCRGDFLAALAALSLLQIVSKHVDRQTCNAILLHNGRVLYRRCPATDEQRLKNFEHGTRVVVRDLFGALPVRVKQRALASKETTSQSKEWSELVQKTAGLLISWPSEVTVILRDTLGDRELRLQTPPAAASLTSRASTVLMQALLADSDDDTSWVPVSSRSRQVSVTGCFSLHPVPTRRSQFLSLGIQPVENVHGSNILFEQIHKIFRASSFGLTDKTANLSQPEGWLRDGQHRKSADKHPMFYLRIETSGTGGTQLSEDHLYAGDSQILETILDLLQAVSYGFLKSHHYRPCKVTKRSSDPPSSTPRKLLRPSGQSPTGTEVSKSTRLATSPLHSGQRPSSPFDGWNRIKIGVASTVPSKPTMSKRFGKQRLLGANGTVLRRPFQDFPTEFEDELATGTGNRPSWLPSQRDQIVQKTCEPKRARTSMPLQEPRSRWLADLVKAWENPVFEVAEQSVPMSNAGLSYSSGEHSHHWTSSNAEATLLNSAAVGLKRRLHKDALAQAEVISQVDKKFILVKLPTHHIDEADTKAENTLVMLDQHAVDERCQLEDLLAGYFSQNATGSYVANTECLEQPIAIEMSYEEAALLRQYHHHFQDWGIMYTVPEANGVSAVRVNSLPPSILERCRTEARLLIDLLRHEVWRLHDAGAEPSQFRGSSDSTSNHHPWVGLFRGCPRGVLDLLHSRSCRSAIMFNDPLSMADCTRLIQRLSRCAFPFQCAHGRPSMAPLLDLGTEPRPNAWTGEEPVEARRARWKTWLETTS
ncbi:hypothetical protein NLU13_4294 [Sarocladium strictum]|uniref:MutL C-terminal dimerisation domain-containing protein n=1 Tax=Sarocladium strictum TaxID=5046 RepID=A0AA39GIM3_SARSR|nr:hypothetical protein NLU13_4294 [Sarocladium strictum]